MMWAVAILVSLLWATSAFLKQGRVSGYGFEAIQGLAIVGMNLAAAAYFFGWHGVGKVKSWIKAGTGGRWWCGVAAGVAAFLGSLLFIFAMGRYDPNAVTIVAYSSPVFALLLNAAVMGDRIGLHHVLGFLMVLGGVALVTLGGR